jgi:hypothetical protein
VQVPDFLTFDASLSFSPEVPFGDAQLRVAATNSAGFGETAALALTADPPVAPDGVLYFVLSWDTESDLDLHVVDPDGVEIWARNISSVSTAPGSAPDPNALATAGVLDVDSNASCVIDGRREEIVSWRKGPPPGRYQVRVDTFSLCGTPGARWQVEARLRGERIAIAQGTSSELDTRSSHDRGAGVLALDLVVPE